MKILHRYILKQLLWNIFLSLLVFIFLFLIFDFFDRIDNILAEKAGILTIIEYFALKVPGTFTLVCPIAMLVGTLFTIGLLSKNSEITAMRAAGCTVWWLAAPAVITGLVVTLISLAFNETAVPAALKRVKQ